MLGWILEFVYIFLDIFVMGEIFDVCICILNIVWWGLDLIMCI